MRHHLFLREPDCTISRACPLVCVSGCEGWRCRGSGEAPACRLDEETGAGNGLDRVPHAIPILLPHDGQLLSSQTYWFIGEIRPGRGLAPIPDDDKAGQQDG